MFLPFFPLDFWMILGEAFLSLPCVYWYTASFFFVSLLISLYHVYHVAIAALFLFFLHSVFIGIGERKKLLCQFVICGYNNSVFICCSSPVTISGQGFLVSLCNCIALKLVSAINICVSMHSEATDCSVLVCSAQPIISSPMHPPP